MLVKVLILMTSLVSLLSFAKKHNVSTIDPGPTIVLGPSRPLQLTSVNTKRAKNVCMYSCFVVLCVILVVMCICVIYKLLSLGLWSAANICASQAKNNQAKPSAWEAAKASNVMWWVKRLSLLWERSKDGLIHCSVDNTS